jgi:hypothetical protein
MKKTSVILNPGISLKFGAPGKPKISGKRSGAAGGTVPGWLIVTGNRFF